MRAPSAAPEGGTSGRGIIEGGDSIIPQGGIPPHLKERLAAERIYTLDDWARRSRRRKRQIWGITIEHVRLLDALTSKKKVEMLA